MDRNNYPQRKTLRIENYDYSTPGSYFITICTANRQKLFWSDLRDKMCASTQIPLSKIGMIAENEIHKLNNTYNRVRVDKYCIMPDHIHMIITVDSDTLGQAQVSPTISRAVKQFKGAITKQVGRPIWQKSFYDHGIRNQQDYNETWEYIENNPLKYLLNRAAAK